MQVLACRRAISLVEVRKPEGTSSSGHDYRAGWSQDFATARRHVRGFTLIELMITLAIALVLIMIAVPSFQRITISSKLTTTANDVVDAINIARMEAIKRNASTQMCGSASNGTDTLGTKCGTQAGAVYALIAGTTPTATQIRAASTGIAGSIVLTGNMAAVRFNGQGLGLAPTGATLGPIADISTSAISTDNHRCITMTAGSIIQTTTSSGACP